MKTDALLLIVVWTFSIVSTESRSQDRAGSNVPVNEKMTGKKLYRTALSPETLLRTERNEARYVLAHTPKKIEANTSDQRDLPKGSFDEVPKQLLKISRNAKIAHTKSYLIDTVIAYSTSDTERFSYSFNSSGTAASCFWEHWQGGHWADGVLFSFTYDAGGRLLTNLRESVDLYTFTYDASGHTLTNLYQVWQNGQWTNSWIVANTYDADGNKLTSSQKLWQNGQWTDLRLDTYTYDARKNELTDLYAGILDSQMTNIDLHTFTYDADGHMLTRLYQTWQNGEWTNSWNYISTYDSTGHLLTELLALWQNSHWTNSEFDTCTYDARGNKLTDLKKQWWNGGWTNYRIDTCSYDAGGNQLIDLEDLWQNNQWISAWRTIRTYGANGNLLTELIEYSPGNDQWTNTDYYSFTYDAAGEQLTDLYENWDDFNQLTFASYCDTCTYDSNRNLTSAIHKSWQGSAWTPSNTDIHGFDDPNFEFYSGCEIKFSYLPASALGVVENTHNVTLEYSLSQNYPNPFNPSTTISYRLPVNSLVTLKVYDELGREIKSLVNEHQNAGSHNVAFNASGLPSAVYFYRLQAGTYSNTKKFLLLK